MDVSELVFTCTKMKSVGNVQKWLNEGSAIVYRKIDDMVDYYFYFLLASILAT